LNGRIYEVVSGKVSVVHEEHNDATEKISVDPSSTCSDPTSTSVELYTLGPHEFIGVNVCSSRTLHSKNPSIFHMIFKKIFPSQLFQEFFNNDATAYSIIASEDTTLSILEGYYLNVYFQHNPMQTGRYELFSWNLIL
jgi:hypothetical protein